MNERVSNTHSKGERVKIPLLLKQSKIKGAGQRQWSRQHAHPFLGWFFSTTIRAYFNPFAGRNIQQSLAKNVLD